MTPSTPSLPFFEKFKKEHPVAEPPPPSDTTEEAPELEVELKPEPVPEPVPAPVPEPSTPLSPSHSESEYGGLAYADSTETEDAGGLAYAASSSGDIGGLAYAASTADTEEGGLAYADDDDTTSNTGTIKPEKPANGNKVRFPSMSGNSVSRSDSKYSSASSSSGPSPRLPMRSLSQSTTYTMRSNAKSTGALDRAMETLFEEDATSPTTSSISSPAVHPLVLGDSQRDSMRPKLPMRSHTTPGLGQNRPDSRSVAGKKKAPRVKNCLKCEKTIDDGRWIQMEGGGVMCGECWKNMYLPKVSLNAQRRGVCGCRDGVR